MWFWCNERFPLPVARCPKSPVVSQGVFNGSG